MPSLLVDWHHARPSARRLKRRGAAASLPAALAAVRSARGAACLLVAFPLAALLLSSSLSDPLRPPHAHCGPQAASALPTGAGAPREGASSAPSRSPALSLTVLLPPGPWQEGGPARGSLSAALSLLSSVSRSAAAGGFLDRSIRVLLFSPPASAGGGGSAGPCSSAASHSGASAPWLSARLLRPLLRWLLPSAPPACVQLLPAPQTGSSSGFAAPVAWPIAAPGSVSPTPASSAGSRGSSGSGAGDRPPAQQHWGLASASLLALLCRREALRVAVEVLPAAACAAGGERGRGGGLSPQAARGNPEQPAAGASPQQQDSAPSAAADSARGSRSLSADALPASPCSPLPLRTLLLTQLAGMLRALLAAHPSPPPLPLVLLLSLHLQAAPLFDAAVERTAAHDLRPLHSQWLLVFLSPLPRGRQRRHRKPREPLPLALLLNPLHLPAFLLHVEQQLQCSQGEQPSFFSALSSFLRLSPQLRVFAHLSPPFLPSSSLPQSAALSPSLPLSQSFRRPLLAPHHLLRVAPSGVAGQQPRAVPVAWRPVPLCTRWDCAAAPATAAQVAESQAAATPPVPVLPSSPPSPLLPLPEQPIPSSSQLDPRVLAVRPQLVLSPDSFSCQLFDLASRTRTHPPGGGEGSAGDPGLWDDDTAAFLAGDMELPPAQLLQAGAFMAEASRASSTMVDLDLAGQLWPTDARALAPQAAARGWAGRVAEVAWSGMRHSFHPMLPEDSEERSLAVRGAVRVAAGGQWERLRGMPPSARAEVGLAGALYPAEAPGPQQGSAEFAELHLLVHGSVSLPPPSAAESAAGGQLQGSAAEEGAGRSGQSAVVGILCRGMVNQSLQALDLAQWRPRRRPARQSHAPAPSAVGMAPLAVAFAMKGEFSIGDEREEAQSVSGSADLQGQVTHNQGMEPGTAHLRLEGSLALEGAKPPAASGGAAVVPVPSSAAVVLLGSVTVEERQLVFMTEGHLARPKDGEASPSEWKGSDSLQLDAVARDVQKLVNSSANIFSWLGGNTASVSLHGHLRKLERNYSLSMSGLLRPTHIVQAMLSDED